MRPSVSGLAAALLALIASHSGLYVFGEDTSTGRVKAQVAFINSVSSAPDILADNVDALERDTFHIFNSVHHLLRQWGNTISPNGFSFTRGTIPTGTPLYHARGDSDTPASPEWLAFDPEMSYAIMMGRCNTFLRTYRAARPLNILYIDGNSASLTDTGTLDSQDILMYGYVKPRTRETVFDEFERARNLCAWGQPRGIDGFVRQNSGFEVVKCAFEDGLTLVKNLNVTAWSASFESDSSKNNTSRWCLDRWPPDEPQNLTTTIDSLADAALHELTLSRFGEKRKPSRPPHPLLPPSLSAPNRPRGEVPSPRRYPVPKGQDPEVQRPVLGLGEPKPKRPWVPPGLSDNPHFINQIRFEWARIAAAVYNGPGEYRVKLDTGTFVTAYGRSGLSGVDSPNTTDHRLVNMTRAAAVDLRSDIEAFFNAQSPLSRSDLKQTSRTLSGINWRDVTDQVVSRYGDRLLELFNYLNKAASPLSIRLNGKSNANETRFDFESARILVSLLLVPHYDLSVGVSRDDNLRACVEAQVPDLDLDVHSSPLYASERLIAKAIQRTQQAICQTLLSVHEELSKATPIEKQTPQVLKKAAGIARNRVSDLMNKLRWTSWKSCDRKCGHDEICLITLWPLSGFDFTIQDPKCANATNWMDDFERRRRVP